MKMNPPTATAQERKIKIINGRPVFFDTQKVREARAILMNHLSMHKPRRPLEGPIGGINKAAPDGDMACAPADAQRERAGRRATGDHREQ